MVSDAAWRVEVYDADCALVGVCDVWTRLAVSLKHRAGGGWTLDLPADHPQADLFNRSRRIVVWTDWTTPGGIPLLSGPLTSMVTTTKDASKPSMLTVTGIDDTALLADRIVLPVPTSQMWLQGDEAYWTDEGNAEGVIRRLVGYNAGTLGLSERRICDEDPDDRLASPGSLYGSTRTVSARFDNLLTLVNELATTDNLAVKVYQDTAAQDLYLSVTTTTDLSSSVMLSFGVGTLQGATASIGAPTATDVLLAGGGEGEDRVLLHRFDNALSAAWGRRVEVFRDARDTSDLQILAERGDETLAEAAATAGLDLDPVDLPAQRFGVDYNLGDTVRVELAGEVWTDIVTAVNIDVTAGGGAAVKPVVGNPDLADTHSPVLYRRVRDLMRRIEALERRV
jgi:hypothetical protein